MFRCYENVVYPGHGVARISRIVEKKIGGVLTTFYELTFLSKDVTVLVPTDNATIVGLRSLSSLESIDGVFKLLASPTTCERCPEFSASSWNKRNKGYQLKLRTGSLQELSEIYRDLRSVEEHKTLSFGEKNLLSQAEALLIEEISLVKKIEQDAVAEKLRTCYQQSKYVQL